MFILQKIICCRSTQSSPPTILHAGALPEGQQEIEPQTMAGQTEGLETMGWAGRSGARSGMAQTTPEILETQFPLILRACNCAT